MDMPKAATFSPPLEAVGIYDRIAAHTEKSCTRIAAITAVAATCLWIIGFSIVLIPMPTVPLMIGAAFGSMLATNAATTLMNAAFKVAKHRWWENVILPRKKSLPAPTKFSTDVFSKRTVSIEKKPLANLSHNKGDSLPTLKLQGKSHYENGQLQGQLMAKEIHHLFHAVYKPLIEENPSVKEKAREWHLLPEYEDELHGIADGLKNYEKTTSYPLKEIDFTALKAANFAMEALRESNTRVLENRTVEHLDHTPSKGLLSRYAFKCSTEHLNPETGLYRNVEWMTYPALIGTSIATNSDGVIVAVESDNKNVKLPKEIPSSLIARALAEGISSVKDAKTVLDTGFKTAAHSITIVDPSDVIRAKTDGSATTLPIQTEPLEGKLHTTMAAKITPGKPAFWERDYYAAHRKL